MDIRFNYYYRHYYVIEDAPDGLWSIIYDLNKNELERIGPIMNKTKILVQTLKRINELPGPRVA